MTKNRGPWTASFALAFSSTKMSGASEKTHQDFLKSWYRSRSSRIYPVALSLHDYLSIHPLFPPKTSPHIFLATQLLRNAFGQDIIHVLLLVFHDRLEALHLDVYSPVPVWSVAQFMKLLPLDKVKNYFVLDTAAKKVNVYFTEMFFCLSDRTSTS